MRLYLANIWFTLAECLIILIDVPYNDQSQPEDPFDEVPVAGQVLEAMDPGALAVPFKDPSQGLLLSSHCLKD